MRMFQTKKVSMSPKNSNLHAEIAPNWQMLFLINYVCPKFCITLPLLQPNRPGSDDLMIST